MFLLCSILSAAGLAAEVAWGRGYPGVSGGGYSANSYQKPPAVFPSSYVQSGASAYSPNHYGRGSSPKPTHYAWTTKLPSYGSHPTNTHGGAYKNSYNRPPDVKKAWKPDYSGPPTYRPPKATYGGNSKPSPYTGGHGVRPQPPGPYAPYKPTPQRPRPPTPTSGGYGGGSLTPPPNPSTDPCFNIYPDCTIVHAQPFYRMSNIGIDECKRECRARQDIGDRYRCVSIVFTKEHRICDLYAHKGNDYPSRLVSLYGSDYYEYRPETCEGPGPRPTTARPPPAGNEDECTATNPNQVTRYIQTIGFAPVGLAPLGNPITGITEVECLRRCTTDGLCMSIEFALGDCQLFSTSVDAEEGVEWEEEPDLVYLQKVCVDNLRVRDCPGEIAIARRYPNSILVGFAERVEDAQMIEDCLGFCFQDLDRCRSLIFFKTPENLGTLNCVLNQVDKDSPETQNLFLENGDDTADYIEVLCGPARPIQAFRSSRRRQAKLSKSQPPRPTLPANSHLNMDPGPRNLSTAVNVGSLSWLEWSPCDRRRDGRRMRYRACPPELRPCPLQTEWCNQAQAQAQTKETKEEATAAASLLHSGEGGGGGSDSGPILNCGPGVCCPIDNRCEEGVLLEPKEGKYRLCRPPVGCSHP